MGTAELLKSKVARVGIVAAGVVALNGCGATAHENPPTPEEINLGKTVIIMNGFTAANGEPLRCIYYASGTDGTNQSKSWFDLDCDFEGTAFFPSEYYDPTSTTTTLP